MFVPAHTAVLQLFVWLALGNFVFEFFIFLYRKNLQFCNFIYQLFSLVQGVWIESKSMESVTKYIEAKRNRSEFLSTEVSYSCFHKIEKSDY
jgi:hypothetical protein